MVSTMRGPSARRIFGRYCAIRTSALQDCVKAWTATARIILLGLAMDVIYQVMVFNMFYPIEALIIALLLAFVPYLLIRGLVVRVWHARASAGRVL